MVNKVIIVIFLTTFIVSGFCERRVKASRTRNVVVCYLRTVELYGEPLYKLDVKELSLCTHLVLQIALFPHNNYTIIVDSLLHIGGNTEERINADFISGIKKSHPQIKITMGIDFRYDEFRRTSTALLKNQETTQKMNRNVLALLRQFNLDGFDIFIWDLPADRADFDNLLFMIQELKEEFILYDYILTATFTDVNKLVDFTKELAKLGSYLDLLGIATTGTMISKRRLGRTVLPLRSENESNDTSLEFIIKHLLDHGVKRNKLVLMSFLYGQNHLLSDPEVEEIQDEDITPITHRKLFVYKDICLEQKKGEKSWVYGWYEKFSAPYVREEDLIVFYENPKSIVSKIKLAIDYNLKGVAIWGMQWDDYKGQCDLPNDTYVEFIERFNNFTEDPNLLEKLKDLKIPKVSTTGDFHGKSYGVVNNTLCFKTPEVTSGPYPLLRTINQAIALSLEEKKILDALKASQKSQRRYCLFWPNCAAPISPPKPANNSSLKT